MRVLILILFVLPCWAADSWQTLDSIVATARQHLASRLPNAIEYEIQIRPLDSRLNLSACTSPLVSSTAQDSRFIGNVTVLVRCDDNPGWRTYVNATVVTTQAVVVALRPLTRGSRIQAGDIGLVRWPSHQLRGTAFAQVPEVIGLMVRNNAAAQEPLLKTQVCMICKGDSVQLIAGDERFSVGIAGIAAGFGNLGERLEVINPASRRHIYGTVVGPNSVRVDNLVSMQ